MLVASILITMSCAILLDLFSFVMELISQRYSQRLLNAFHFVLTLE